MPKVRFFGENPNLIPAIEDGTVDGDVYADGEVWVDPDSYKAWAGTQPETIMDGTPAGPGASFTGNI